MCFYLLPRINHSTQQIHSFISETYTSDEKEFSDIIVNKTLHKYLNRVKTQIDARSVEWDKYKKYTNPYEFIHSTIPASKQSVSSLKPLSRSFYKMVEICKLMNILADLPAATAGEATASASASCKSFHLAEGPGGFIEAFVQLRKNEADTYYGMTLLNDRDYNVPGWRKSNVFLTKNKNVVIEKGKDGTGNLMNPENLRDCYERYNGTMDFITGDGGFDFSVDFNNQEQSSLKLIFCQIAFAIAMQKINGCFVLKCFDTFTKMSLDLLYLLSMCYEQVYFVKPNTSRYANSEKYIVCKKFKLQQTEPIVKKCYKIMNEMNNGKNIISLFNMDLPYLFTNKIEEYNAILGQQQIENIASTLNLINNNLNKNENLETMKKNHITKCNTWCQIHNIPYNKQIQHVNIFMINKT